MTIPTITLNDTRTIPQLGLGVWRASDGNEVTQAVEGALTHGYRLIDTAAVYGNERGVGEGIRRSGVPREELFITTKLWNADQGYETTFRAFDASLERLGLDYIDLYLIHWPVPKLDKYIETWKAFKEIQASGRAKSIGVCNFPIDHLEWLMNESGVVPAINQIELHPRLQQRELREFCQNHGIQVESWSPIGGAGSDLLTDVTLRTIADKHNRTPAQIVIRWHVQLGLVVIPKSVHVDRIIENATVFDFELDNDDMAKISALDSGERYGPDPETMNHH